MSGRRLPIGRLELAAAAAYVAIFAATYPSTFAIVDESAYLSTAYVYRAGTIWADVAGIDGMSRVAAGGHVVAKFAPLWPALLAAFTLPGWRGAFAANLVLHLAGFFTFAAILRRAGAPRWTSLLYLAHPTLVYYSRTLMSDVAAGVPVLVAWAAWTGERRRASFRAGLWTGVSCLVRYTNIVLAAIWVAAAAVDELRRGRRPSRAAGFALGLVPPFVLLAVYDQLAFGKWWRGTAGYADERAGIGMHGQFGPAELLPGLAHYGLALAMLWPLLPLALLAVRGRHAFVQRALALGFTLFFCFYYYRDDATGPLQTAVVGLRFLVPVLPLYLLAYAEVLGRATSGRRASRLAGPVAAAVAAAATIVVSVRHETALDERAAERDRLYAVTAPGARILCDTGARKLLSVAWGPRHAERVEFRGRWELPPPGEAAGAYVAMAGRGRDPDAVPALRTWLSAAGARPLPGPEQGSRLRIWVVPGDGASGGGS